MTTHDSSAFGTLLRSHRVEAGLSQERLAERAGLSARGISDLERGERQAPVMPLSLPEGDGPGSVVGAAGAQAVRLFIARGQVARPDFKLDDDNVAAVGDICRFLESS